jgi:hypothetical protein
MKLLRTVVLSGALALFSSPLFCAHISMLIVETGLRDGPSVRRGGMTEIWETGLMDVFFEEGHIVTNARTFALKKKPGKDLTGEIKSYITEAESVGIDYFVLAYLNYETTMDAAANGGRFSELPKPADIEFNLFNINPSKINPAQGTSKCVWTQNIDLRRDSYPAKQEQIRARRAARSLIVHLGDTL